MRHWRYATIIGFTNVPALRVVLLNRRVALPSKEIEFPTTNAEGTVQAGFLYKIG